MSTGCGNEAKYQLKSGKWCCSQYCGQCPELRRRNSEKNKERIRKLIETGQFHSNFTNYNKTGKCWNKGLTKETDERVKQISTTLKTKFENKELIPAFKGKTHTEEAKKLIGLNGRI